MNFEIFASKFGGQFASARGGQFSRHLQTIHDFILYNREKWDSLLEKYKHEPKDVARRKSIYVLIYLIGSIVLFFATLPLLAK